MTYPSGGPTAYVMGRGAILPRESERTAGLEGGAADSRVPPIPAAPAMLMMRSARAVPLLRRVPSRPARPTRRRASAEGAGETEAAQCGPDSPDCVEELEGSVKVRDDLDSLLQVLPPDIRSVLLSHPERANLLEVVLDLGRSPEARFQGGRDRGTTAVEILRERVVDWSDLAGAEEAVGEFGGDNRAGIEGTLHRISAMRNRRGVIVGLTCRVGRAVTGHIDMIRDVIEGPPRSILFLGRPGVGKTTVIREIARVMADELGKRVVIVDTSNEIGGDGDVPHPAIGRARRM